MYLTLKVPLYVNEFEKQVLLDYGEVFHKEINVIIERFVKMDQIVFYPYKWINSEISFYSKSAVIHLAETFYESRKKGKIALYHPLFTSMGKAIILQKNCVTLFFGKGFHKALLKIPITLTQQQFDRLKIAEIVKMDVIKENAKFIARIIISVRPNDKGIYDEIVEMGVDIGMKCPAVCYTTTGKIKFVGNGREIKYHTRRLQKIVDGINKKDARKFGRFHHQLSNYKTYIDHCVSKGIITFATQHGVSKICLEKLTDLQQKFYKHEHLCWSYQRLQKYILYKASIEGIDVVFVNPYLTSKRCPSCGKVNNVNDRNYICQCGFHMHRDIVGAMNILHAPKV